MHTTSFVLWLCKKKNVLEKADRKHCILAGFLLTKERQRRAKQLCWLNWTTAFRHFMPPYPHSSLSFALVQLVPPLIHTSFHFLMPPHLLISLASDHPSLQICAVVRVLEASTWTTLSRLPTKPLNCHNSNKDVQTQICGVTIEGKKTFIEHMNQNILTKAFFSALHVNKMKNKVRFLFALQQL